MLMLILVGPQGSGKGTQAEYLTDHFHIPSLSIGQLFRSEIAAGTDLGKTVKEAVEAGRLVPQQITIDVIGAALKKPENAAGMILDGFPRDIIQAEALSKIAKISGCVVLEISDEEALNRLSNRLICTKCGRSYNTITCPPVVEGVCDKDGGSLERRKDDAPEAIRERLATYHATTEPIIDYYAKQGIVAHVNGEQPIVEVHEAIVEALKASCGIEKQK